MKIFLVVGIRHFIQYFCLSFDKVTQRCSSPLVLVEDKVRKRKCGRRSLPLFGVE